MGKKSKNPIKIRKKQKKNGVNRTVLPIVSEQKIESVEEINNQYIVTEGRHISSVTFTKLSKNLGISFEKQRSIESLIGMNNFFLKPFTIITGRNGIGKTQLIGYIETLCKGSHMIMSMNEFGGLSEFTNKIHNVILTIFENANPQNYGVFFNKELKKLSLPYYFSKQGEKLFIYKNDIRIGDINVLSHGELGIISLITLRVLRLIIKENKENIHKIKAIDHSSCYLFNVFLYDEPDSAFDPILCNLFLEYIIKECIPEGIQVIMTTHRIDTIASIPQVSIDKGEVGVFAIKDIKSIDRSTDTEMKGEQEPKRTKEIVEITKLEAMYRLTKNLRQFTGHRFEVCTEGFYDAYFYSGVYHSLLDMSKNTPRDSVHYYLDDLLPHNIMPKNLYAYDLDENQHKFIGRAISQRYQMLFRGSSKTDDKGGIKASGGAGDVVTMIERDDTAFKNSDNVPSKYICNDIFSNGEFYIPYGIIDADGKTEKSSNDRVVKPSNKFSLKEDNRSDVGRYAVENFVLDPIALCSTLEENEINEFVDQSLIRISEKDEMKKTCIQIKRKLNALKKGDQVNVNQQDINNLVSKYFYYVFCSVNYTIESCREKNLHCYLKANITILDPEKKKSYIEPLLKHINEHNSTDKPQTSNGVEKLIKKFLDTKEAEITFPLYHNKKTSDVSLKKLDNKNYQSNDKILFLKDSRELKDTILKTEKPTEIISLNSIIIELNKINSLDVDTNNTQKPDHQQVILEKIKNAETRKIDSLFSYSDDETYITTFDYPKWFLELNGHYLEYYCFGMKIADKIAAKVRSQGLSFIPLDLAQVFFDLNEKIRGNVRKVIKPNHLNKSSGKDNGDNYNNKDDYSKRNSGYGIDNLDRLGNGLNNHNSNKSQNTSSNDKFNNKNKPEHKDGTSLNTGQIENTSLLDNIKIKEDTYWYTDEDMDSLGPKKLDMYGIDCNKQFKGRLTEDVVGSLPETNDRIDSDGDTINGLEEGKPMFICYNIGGLANQNGGTHWVAICLIKHENEVYALYKDSKGDFNKSAQVVLWKFWEHYGLDLKFIMHRGKEQEDSSSCGPMTINNLSIMAELIQKEGIQYLVKNFKDIEFSKQSDVSKIRTEHYDILESINRNTPVVSTNNTDTCGDEQKENYYNENDVTPTTLSTNNTDIDSKEENNNSNVNSDPNTNNNHNISFLNKISYTDPNLMLRQGDMLGQAGGIAGMDGINRLISLGEDPEVAKEIISSAKEYGIPTVLTPLMDDIRINTRSNAAVVNFGAVNANVNIDSQSVNLMNNQPWVDRCSTLYDTTSRNYSMGL